MADAAEREARRRRKLLLGAAVAAAAVLGAGALVLVLVLPGGGPDGPDRPSGPSVRAASSAPPPEPSAATPRLTLGPTASLGTTGGYDGQALLVTGNADGYAEAEGAALDTGADFTVSALVRVDTDSGPKAAVSQNAAAFSSFFLGRDDATDTVRNRWVFKVQTDAEVGRSVAAVSAADTVAGRWTLLTGVYSKQDATIALYVDGVLAQTSPAPRIIPSTGPLEFGRIRSSGMWVKPWNGAIADVRLWKRALTAEQVGALKDAKPGPPTPFERFLAPGASAAP
ncbi:MULTISPECIES: LamG domain-containing protein [Kitasatospora]|nr:MULTISPECIES: LamG domain-containing protein [Kitasatospora]